VAVSSEPSANSRRQVGQTPEQRQGGGVTEQEAADDGGGPLQLVEADADPGQDVGQREHDDVGVGRSDQDGQRGEDDEREAGGRSPGHCRRISRWSVR
jgi:hypothetical protein